MFFFLTLHQLSTWLKNYEAMNVFMAFGTMM
jgi:hypothetical protein